MNEQTSEGMKSFNNAILQYYVRTKQHITIKQFTNSKNAS
jgi:hypothetical protein